MKSIFSLIFLGVAFAVSAQQMGKQTLAQLEESPAGSKIIWFFDEVNSGSLSDESIEKYFSAKLIERVGFDRLKAAFTDVVENDGKIILYQANKLKITEYRLLAKGSKSKGWLEMKFYFEESAPYGIRGYTTDSVPPGDGSLKPIYPKSN